MIFVWHLEAHTYSESDYMYNAVVIRDFIISLVHLFLLVVFMRKENEAGGT
jgi:hypothetical protein